jgi:hypothetical protein
MNRPSVSPCVAPHLPLMAPCLAPRNLVLIARVRMYEYEVGPDRDDDGRPSESATAGCSPIGLSAGIQCQTKLASSDRGTYSGRLLP